MLRFGLLGPLTVHLDDVPVALGPPQQRAVLALLAQDAGAVVGVDRLLDCLWGENQPAKAAASVQSCISHLRRALRTEGAPSVIARRGRGYVLLADAADLDVTTFLASARATRAAIDRRDWVDAVQHGEHALGLWRGAYLADFADEEWTRAPAAALDERRAGVLQHLVTGLLGVGDLAGAVARAGTMVHEQPLVEQATWLRMVALHRAGRTGEALERHRMFARHLQDTLGLDVGTALRELHTALLRQDPGPDTWPGPAAVTAGPTDRAAPDAEPEPAADPAAALVGRREELRSVASTLDAARTGVPRWVVLTGRAGIGKSRLARAAAAEWSAAGGRVVAVTCSEDDTAPPWWPVRQVLRALGADPDAVLTSPPDVDVDAHRFATILRIRDVLVAALDMPLLVLVDDLHWADRSSAAALTLLAETIEHPGLAVLVTSRDESRTPQLDRLLVAIARRPGSLRLTVPPLSAGDIAALVEQISGRRPTDEEAADLGRRTAGNPFYVGEYARLGDADRAAGVTPDAVRTMLRRRLSHLDTPLLDTVGVAAVLGDPIDAALLAQVLDADPDEVADRLDLAADQDLVVPAVSGEGYAFIHALLRDELATGVPTLRRRRLHLRAAECLDGTPNPVLHRAVHLRAAGTLADPAEACTAFRAAAAAAEHQWQAADAAEWWALALVALERRGSAAGTDRDDLLQAQVAALAHAVRGQRMLEVLDEALLDGMRNGRTGSVGVLAANLLRVSGSWPWPVWGSDPAPLLATLRALDPLLVDDPAANVRVLAVTAIGHCYDPDPGVPDTLSRRALELAESTGDDGVLADALLGRTLTYSGVATHARESIELLDRLAGLHHGHARVDAVLRHNLLTMACLTVGDIDSCAEHVTAGALGSDLLRLPVNRVQLRWAQAALAQWRGDPAAAEELVRRAETLHRQTDLQQTGTVQLARLALAWDRGTLADVDTRIPNNPVLSAWTSVVGDAAADRPGVDAALAREVHRAEPDVWTSHGRLVLLAHAVVDRGLTDLAPPLYAGLQPFAGCLAAIGQTGTVGPTALALARLADLQGDRNAARAHLAAAQDLAERTGGSGSVLRCRALALQWALRDGSRDEQVHAELDAVRDRARERGLGGVAFAQPVGVS